MPDEWGGAYGDSLTLRRPGIDLEIRETGWRYWPLFKPHHYLADAGPMPFSTAFVAFVGDEPVAHLGVSGMYVGGQREARACRMVVMPEWQGAGVGMRFLNWVMDRELRGEGFIGVPTQGLFHTNHPALAASLRRDPAWRQVSFALHGESQAASNASLQRAAKRKVESGRESLTLGSAMGYGGHWRGVQGFRYFGQAGRDAAAAGLRGRVSRKRYGK